MRVLVACEFSGTVRDAFAARGWDAWSCDLLPTEKPGNHFQGDISDFLSQDANWDLMVAHPPCTHLCSSGARWWGRKQAEQLKAVEFVAYLWGLPIPRICIENPIGILSNVLSKPTQIIQPWQFGHGETKATCLWLKGLPRLVPANVVSGRESRIHKMSPGPKQVARTKPDLCWYRLSNGRSMVSRDLTSKPLNGKVYTC